MRTDDFTDGLTEQDPPHEQADDQPLPDAFAIAGRIMDDVGAAVSGIEVTAELRRLYTLAGGEDEAEIKRTESAFTDYGGAYYFPGLADGEYQLRTVATDRYTAAQATVRAGVGSADLVVWRKLGKLQVYGGVHTIKGAALEGVQVLPMSQPTAMTSSDADGAYVLDLDLTGNSESYSIRFRREGYQDQTFVVAPTFNDGFDTVALDVALEPLEVTGRVQGSVANTAGEPIAGERVKLFSRDQGRTYTAATNAAGHFLMDSVVPASDYRLEVRPSERYRDYKRTALKVGAAGLDLPVVLQRMDVGTLSGRFVDARGKPVPYFTLLLRSADAIRQVFPVTTDDRGRFVIEDVPAGRLGFESGSHPQLEINGVQLPAGGEKDIDLVVDWGTYSLEGRVVDNRGGPVSGAKVYLTWNLNEDGVTSVSVRRTVSDAQGRFAFTRLGPGTHRVSVDNLPGYGRAGIEHRVGAGGGAVVLRLRQSIW